MSISKEEILTGKLKVGAVVAVHPDDNTVDVQIIEQFNYSGVPCYSGEVIAVTGEHRYGDLIEHASISMKTDIEFYGGLTGQQWRMFLHTGMTIDHGMQRHDRCDLTKILGVTVCGWESSSVLLRQPHMILQFVYIIGSKVVGVYFNKSSFWSGFIMDERMYRLALLNPIMKIMNEGRLQPTNKYYAIFQGETAVVFHDIDSGINTTVTHAKLDISFWVEYFRGFIGVGTTASPDCPLTTPPDLTTCSTPYASSGIGFVCLDENNAYGAAYRNCDSYTRLDVNEYRLDDLDTRIYIGKRGGEFTRNAELEAIVEADSGFVEGNSYPRGVSRPGNANIVARPLGLHGTTFGDGFELTDSL